MKKKLSKTAIKLQEELKAEMDEMRGCDNDENDFQPCDDCDLPDACEDYGCAIKSGIKKKPFTHNW